MFIKVTDLDTNCPALVNPEKIDCILKIGLVYRVTFSGSYIVISDTDFERVCATVGYAVGNGSEPTKYQIPPHDQMPDPLGGLGAWADKEVEDDDD
jgi:hypothetical protein